MATETEIAFGQRVQEYAAWLGNDKLGEEPYILGFPGAGGCSAHAWTIAGGAASRGSITVALRCM